MANKSPLKGAWSESRDPILNFQAANGISEMAKARVIKFCTQGDYIIS